MPTFDVSIVLTITAKDEKEAAEKVFELTGLSEDELPDWSALAIRRLKA